MTYCRIRSTELHFRGCNDSRIERFGDVGKADGRRHPPMVAEGTPKRGLARDVAGEANALRVEAIRNGDRTSFWIADHRLEREVLAHHLAAPLMHHSRGRADLGIGKRGDVFLEEVDEPALALEHGEQEQP